MDAGERTRHCGAETPAEEDRSEVRSWDFGAFAFVSSRRGYTGSSPVRRRLSGYGNRVLSSPHPHNNIHLQQYLCRLSVFLVFFGVVQQCTISCLLIHFPSCEEYITPFPPPPPSLFLVSLSGPMHVSVCYSRSHSPCTSGCTNVPDSLDQTS